MLLSNKTDALIYDIYPENLTLYLSYSKSILDKMGAYDGPLSSRNDQGKPDCVTNPHKYDNKFFVPWYGPPIYHSKDNVQIWWWWSGKYDYPNTPGASTFSLLLQNLTTMSSLEVNAKTLFGTLLFPNSRLLEYC